MAAANDLARMVPGFEFLQDLLKNAGAGIPGVGHWIAPTLDPAELDKRIQELKTVQFWLEQNARLLATTIQALEVQRMTLATLQTMNLPLADLGEALKIKLPDLFAAVPAPAAAPAPPEPAARKAADAAASASPLAAAVDPMQWWGALTQQFTEIAARAVKEGAAESAKLLGGGAVKATRETAAAVARTAAAAPGKAVVRKRAR
jgi:hypothetical protein